MALRTFGLCAAPIGQSGRSAAAARAGQVCLLAQVLALNEADLSILSIEQQVVAAELEQGRCLHVLHVFQKKAKSGIITSQLDGH